MTKKYHTLNVNILLRLTIINLLVKPMIKQKELVHKPAIAGFINNTDLDKKKVATLATKSESKTEQDKIIKLQAFDSSYFHDKK